MKIAILAPMRQELAPVVQAFSLQRTTVGDTVVQTGHPRRHPDRRHHNRYRHRGCPPAAEQLFDDRAPRPRHGRGHRRRRRPDGGDRATWSSPAPSWTRPSGTEYRPTHLGNPAPTARGKIVTSDDFLIDRGMLDDLIADDVVALDMETSVVAEVCVGRGCDWSVIRAISDMATDHPDDAVLGLANPDGSANGAAVAKFLLTKPWRIPSLAKLQQRLEDRRGGGRARRGPRLRAHHVGAARSAPGRAGRAGGPAVRPAGAGARTPRTTRRPETGRGPRSPNALPATGRRPRSAGRTRRARSRGRAGTP